MQPLYQSKFNAQVLAESELPLVETRKRLAQQIAFVYSGHLCYPAIVQNFVYMSPEIYLTRKGLSPNRLQRRSTISASLIICHSHDPVPVDRTHAGLRKMACWVSSIFFLSTSRCVALVPKAAPIRANTMGKLTGNRSSMGKCECPRTLTR